MPTTSISATARASATGSTFSKSRDNAPTLLFIHGGYWQIRAKETFALFAEGPMAHGINVALIGYTLAPEATLDQIVAEIHAGIDFLAAQLPDLGGDGKGIVRVADGRRAGISSRWRCRILSCGRGWRSAASTTSSRSAHSYLNVKLGLDEAASRRNSPMNQAGGPAKPLSLVVGSSELPLLRKQTADFAGHRAKFGLPVTYEEIPGADHFSIMNEMVSPEGRITTLIRQLVERTGSLSFSRHCERSEAIHRAARKGGLLRRCAPRNDGVVSVPSPIPRRCRRRP